MNNYGSDIKSALHAKYDAQKIAFAPIMFQAARALRNLGILEYLLKNKRKGASIETVAKALKISVYGTKVLLEAGLSLEMVMIKDTRYHITKTGYFILSDELTKVNMDFTQDVNYLGMMQLEESILKGKPEGLKVFGNWDTVYEALSDLPLKVRNSWFAFDHYYSDYAFPEVLPHIFRSKPKKILDVGGNTGRFSIYCAENNEDIHLTILDLPGQIKDAKVSIYNAGLDNRISTKSLNLLDNSIPFPTGYDVIWMSQFLDCFSQEEILGLLKRSYNALDNDGALYILETYWDKQEFEASTYSLHATSLYFTAIANGNSQMYHSNDMGKLIDKSGLYIEDVVENIGVSHTLFKCKRKQY
ncbi:MAG: methyltransferase [Bacteroidetes bacterium]|nr:methyltransferase [Bacteroidota bacterium]MBL6944136.1 methyltransferase [Bacteroidales bacterium]